MFQLAEGLVTGTVLAQFDVSNVFLEFMFVYALSSCEFWIFKKPQIQFRLRNAWQNICITSLKLFS